MNIMLLVAFGLVAFGSVLRLILLFTNPKDRTC
jgi:hypothetical protein